jgi:hypothetical protein
VCKALLVEQIYVPKGVAIVFPIPAPENLAAFKAAPSESKELSGIMLV